MFPKRPLPLLLAIITLGLFLHVSRCWDAAPAWLRSQSGGINTTKLALQTEDYLEQVIRDNGLTHKVEWAAWHIKPTQTLPRWDSLTSLRQPFQPRGVQVFDLDEPVGKSPLSNGAFNMLELPAPRGAMPGEFDASEYLFGVSTTYERLMENDRAIVKGWQWWLTNGNQTTNGAHIIVILDHASHEQIFLVESLLKSLDIAASVYKTDETLSSATRYIQMTRELRAFSSALSAAGLYKKWFSLIDDSVFFPNMDYLGQRLSAYDSEKPVYIGLPSEADDWQENAGALSTHGGGAVMLSRPALNKFLNVSCAEPSVSDAPYHSQRWGKLLHECLTTKGGMKMHVLPGLYSPRLDRKTNDVNLYEAGGRPLALHSRTTWRDFTKAYLVADECGEACFMQRYLFSDGWVLVNGVSITQYQRQVRLETGQRQMTGLSEELVYDDVESERVHLMEGGERNVWRLLDAYLDDSGVAWQAYVKKAQRGEDSESGAKMEVDSVILFIWNAGK